MHESGRPNVGIAFTQGVDKNENYDEVSTTRQRLEKGKSSWKEMKIGGKKWSSWQRATAKAKDARSPV